MYRKVKLNIEIPFKCVSCQQIGVFYETDAVFELLERNEEPMGTGNRYGAIIETQCAHCGNSQEFLFEVLEYPQGIIEHENFTGKGVTLLSLWSAVFEDKEME